MTQMQEVGVQRHAEVCLLTLSSPLCWRHCIHFTVIVALNAAAVSARPRLASVPVDAAICFIWDLFWAPVWDVRRILLFFLTIIM